MWSFIGMVWVVSHDGHPEISPHSHSHSERVSGTTGSGVSGNTLIRAVQRHAFGRGIGRDRSAGLNKATLILIISSYSTLGSSELKYRDTTFYFL